MLDVVCTNTRRGYASTYATMVFLGALLAYLVLEHESDALKLVAGVETKFSRRSTSTGLKGQDGGEDTVVVVVGSSNKGVARRNTDNSVLAQKFGVKPTAKAPRWVWRISFWLQRKALPALYAWDPLRPPNYDLSLLCLWLKATSHKDPHCPILYDNYLSYDMLPLVTRRFGTSTLFRPRLLRAIIELRSAYLQYAIQASTHRILSQQGLPPDPKVRLRLVSFGTGYDIRSIQLRMTNTIDDAYELDRPEVMSIKQPLMERLLLRQNQRKANITKPLDKYHLPKLIGIDLNNVTQVQRILMDILGSGNDINSRKTAVEYRDQPRIVWHTIFLFEGVMIYLNKGVPTELLRICSTVCPSHSTLVFADRLEHIIDSEGAGSSSSSRECATNVLKNVGWKLEDWCTKPGFARHMGIATTPS